MSAPRLHLSRRDLRLGTGLVLFTYIAFHLANHALGLASLALAESGLRLAVLVWHSVPGTALLYSAAAIHLVLAFQSIYARRTLRLPADELLRILLGLGMPLLLIGHIAATRLAFEIHGLAPEYRRIVWALWNSDNEGRQLALLVPGWLHGCMGLHFAFSHRPVLQKMRLALFAAALLLPVLAGLGFLSMAREVGSHAADPAWLANAGLPVPEVRISIGRLREALLAAYFFSLASVFGARVVRAQLERRWQATVEIRYPHRSVRVPLGWTVLEASRGFAIPHVSMCGGRARCSTCRVRIIAGERHCPPSGEDERATLARVGAPADVRLACQLRPTGDIDVVPLLGAERRWFSAGAPRTATERDIALLLLDLPARQAFACAHLPQDTLYLLSRVAEVFDGAVRAPDGVVGRAGGAEFMAVFGLCCDLAQASRHALRAAADIEAGMRKLNAQFAPERGAGINYALVIHTGRTAVGEIGLQDAVALTAVGEAVDIANHLRALAAARGTRFAISAAACTEAGLAPAERLVPASVEVDGISVEAFLSDSVPNSSASS